MLKETVSRDFLLQVFFHESCSPKPLKLTLGSIQIFRKLVEIFASHGAPLVSTTPVLNNGEIILDCLHIKENFYLYVNSNGTTQRCPYKIFKTFLIEDFLFVIDVNDTGGAS